MFLILTAQAKINPVYTQILRDIAHIYISLIKDVAFKRLKRLIQINAT